MKPTPKQIEKIKEGGWINAYFLIEVQGNDKEHIKKALEEMIGKLKMEQGIEIYSEKYDEIRELREKLYAYNVELKFIAKDFGRLTHAALLYSPSVVEIYEPKEIKIPVGEAQNMLVDVANIITSLAHTIFIQSGKLRKYEPPKKQEDA